MCIFNSLMMLYLKQSLIKVENNLEEMVEYLKV